MHNARWHCRRPKTDVTPGGCAVPVSKTAGEHITDVAQIDRCQSSHDGSLKIGVNLPLLPFTELESHEIGTLFPRVYQI